MELWLARSKDNSLTLCTHKQVYYKDIDIWEKPNEFYNDNYAFAAYIPENLFPEVKFENSPMKVELKLIQDDK